MLRDLERFSQGICLPCEVPVKFLKTSQSFEIEIGGRVFVDLELWRASLSDTSPPSLTNWLNRPENYAPAAMGTL